MNVRTTFTDQKGQALLIVILVMVVALTIGISIASRSIVSLRTASEEENSQRALSAAEAGIEQFMNSNQSGIVLQNEDLGNKSRIGVVNISQVDGTEFILNGGNPVPKDDGADLWLVPHSLTGEPEWNNTWNGSFTIYWGASGEVCNADPNVNSQAAIEIITIFGDAATPESRRNVFDPCGLRRSSNNFANSAGGGTVGDKSFAYSSGLINVTDGLLVRIVPLYAGTPIAVRGDNIFPSQGKKIEATGISGETERKITFYQGYAKLPSEFFQHILFSP